MIIRKVKMSELDDALALVLHVFLEFEAPEYSEEGVKTFKEILSDKDAIQRLEMYGAYLEDKIVGVIATRNNGTHISLFFVDSSYHRQGIGNALFQTLLHNRTISELTVNSSPYAVAVYKRFGFEATDTEQLKDGIRYTPMLYKNKTP